MGSYFGAYSQTEDESGAIRHHRKGSANFIGSRQALTARYRQPARAASEETAAHTRKRGHQL